MPAWKPEGVDPVPGAPSQPHAVPAAEASAPATKSKPPAKAKPAITPEVVERHPSARRRSSASEARERLAEAQLPALNARLDLAGIGDDPLLAARDESVRARLLTDLNVHGGLVAPSVSVQLHVPLDPEAALVDLERILGGAG